MDDWEEIDCIFVVKTERAVLIRGEDDEETWIPLSLVDDNDEDDLEYAERNDEITINVKGWFARQEDLV